MSIREKRLRNDFQSVSDLVSNSGGTLKVISTQGNPPFQYILEYRCKGLEELPNNTLGLRKSHQVSISLGERYPKQQPDAKFLTSIFHPNVYPNRNICLGNYWTMAETLSELILRIGKIIQYSKDVLNLKSPANVRASRWAELNSSRFPIDTQTFKVQILWSDLI